MDRLLILASTVCSSSSAVPTSPPVWLQSVATKNRLVVLESEAETEPCEFANLSCVGSDGFGERSLHFWSWLSNAERVNAFRVSEAEERHCYTFKKNNILCE